MIRIVVRRLRCVISSKRFGNPDMMVNVPPATSIWKIRQVVELLVAIMSSGPKIQFEPGRKETHCFLTSEFTYPQSYYRFCSTKPFHVRETLSFFIVFPGFGVQCILALPPLALPTLCGAGARLWILSPAEQDNCLLD